MRRGQMERDGAVGSLFDGGRYAPATIMPSILRVGALLP